MVEYEHKNLFDRSSVNKQFRFHIGDAVVTNMDLFPECFEAKESILPNSDYIQFGACESAWVKFKTFRTELSYVNETMLVETILDGNEDDPFVWGTYYPVEEKVTNDRVAKEIKAYDGMYRLLNMDVTEWYNGLFANGPVSVKDMRDGFFDYVGEAQEEVELINDDYIVHKADLQSVTGKTILTSICEINARFGHFGRDNVFKYIKLRTGGKSEYPSQDLYPEDSLIPGEGNSSDVTRKTYINCSFEDYYTQIITGISAKNEDNNVFASVGTNENEYILNNILLYNRSEADVKPVLERFLAEVEGIVFVPFASSMIANPCIEVGDGVNIFGKSSNVRSAENPYISSYVLERHIKGIHSLKDTVGAQSEEYVSSDDNGLQASVDRLSGRASTSEKRISAAEIDVGYLKADHVSVGSLNAVSARVGAIEADYIRTASLDAVSARVGTLEADHVTVKSFNALSATVNTINANYITANSITTDFISGKFQSPNSGYMTMGTMRAANIYIYDGANYRRLNLGAGGNVTWS